MQIGSFGVGLVFVAGGREKGQELRTVQHSSDADDIARKDTSLQQGKKGPQHVLLGTPFRKNTE